MRTFVLLATLGLLAIGFSHAGDGSCPANCAKKQCSCGSDPNCKGEGCATVAGSKAPATQPAPVNKFCPVEKENAVDPKITTVHDGKVIGFCCADCIPTFKKDPAKYMKDLK
jgi:YHS domain-containing protein